MNIYRIYYYTCRVNMYTGACFGVFLTFELCSGSSLKQTIHKVVTFVARDMTVLSFCVCCA